MVPLLPLEPSGYLTYLDLRAANMIHPLAGTHSIAARNIYLYIYLPLSLCLPLKNAIE